jgi:chromosome segregation ATPase
MIEKEQNTENGIKLASLAMDLNLTFTKYNRTNVENEELIERVAKAESNLEEKSEEIQKVNKKKNDYKMYVE